LTVRRSTRPARRPDDLECRRRAGPGEPERGPCQPSPVAHDAQVNPPAVTARAAGAAHDAESAAC
jgi:hypothetical protein